MIWKLFRILVTLASVAVNWFLLIAPSFEAVVREVAGRAGPGDARWLVIQSLLLTFGICNITFVGFAVVRKGRRHTNAIVWGCGWCAAWFLAGAALAAFYMDPLSLLFFCAPAVLTAAALLSVRRPQPTRKGICAHCGYDLTGLDDGAVCPECGKPTTEVPA